jgi:phage shock protein PspC (stress-responsive transcriptional regulator)
VADRLYRSRDDRMLAGVAGGVAEMLDADPSIIRIIWALLVFLTGGLALLVYVVMAIVVPERPEGTPIGSPWAPGGGAPGEGAATPDAGPVPEGGWRAPDGSTVAMAAPTPYAGRRRRDPADRARVGVVVGLLFILIGVVFLIRQLVPAFDLGLWWPTVAIGVGILLVIVALLPPRHSS